MLLTNYIFSKKNYVPNLFIGNAASFLTSPEDLSLITNIPLTSIRSFKTVGPNIEVTILTNWVGPNNMFQNRDLTYFRDDGRKMQAILNRQFLNCPNLTIFEAYGAKSFGSSGGFPKVSQTAVATLYFPEMTHIDGNLSLVNNPLLTSFNAPVATSFLGNGIFQNCTNLAYINIRNVVTQLGQTSGDDGNFLNIKLGCVIDANVFLQTSNAGAMDADLFYAINTRGAVVNWFP